MPAQGPENPSLGLNRDPLPQHRTPTPGNAPRSVRAEGSIFLSGVLQVPRETGKGPYQLLPFGTSFPQLIPLPTGLREAML